MSFLEKVKAKTESIRNVLLRIEMHSVGEPDYDTIDDLTDRIEGDLEDIRELIEDIEEPAV